MQFGINKHLLIFFRPQIALALRAGTILLVFEKNLLVLIYSNCTRNHVITYNNLTLHYRNFSVLIRGIFDVVAERKKKALAKRLSHSKICGFSYFFRDLQRRFVLSFVYFCEKNKRYIKEFQPAFK